MRQHASLGWSGLALSLFVLVGAGAEARAADRETGGKAWLGIYSQSLTSELRDGLNHRGDGVLVNRVVPDSPADRAGLEKGDVIVSVDQRSVNSPDELAEYIRSQDAGDAVSIRIVRDGERRTLNARLAGRPDDEGGSPKNKSDEERAWKDHEKDHENEHKNEHQDHDGSADSKEFKRHHDSAEDLEDLPEVPGVPDRFEIRRMVRDSRAKALAPRALGRGRLGVRVQDINSDLGDYFKSDKGALVNDVVGASPADRGGLKSGDVITEIDGQSIDDSADLIETLRGKEGRISVEVLRRGERRTLDVELDDAPARPRSAPRAFQWRSEDGKGRHGSMLDDGKNDASREELQREVRELRQELRRLRRELEDSKRGR